MSGAGAIECAGIHADLVARTVHALGRLLPVTAVAYSEASPERPGSDRAATPELEEITRLIYKTPERIAAALLRPIPATAESLHFNVLCENGWWIEVSAYPEDDSLSFGPAGTPAFDFVEGDAADLLTLYAEVATRPAYVPSTDPDAYDDPWGDLAPGSWDLVDV